ncbi:MAG: hypothetical protein HY538_02090 [Deltaproteobacteria bacterium]|nr:hypothetical protein [Deltaproteobacteria bacterium]
MNRWVILLMMMFLSYQGFALQAEECQGKPKGFNPGDGVGYAVWVDGDEYHVRWTSKKKEGHRFSGTVTADAEVEAIERVRMEHKMEGGDFVRKAGPRKVEFSGFAAGGQDGFQFQSEKAQHVTFRLELDGQPISAQQVLCGKGDARPDQVPFVIHK